jgi:hypothetical protein
VNKRLHEHIHDADPALARAAKLVASIPPIPRSEARKDRVRRAVFESASGRDWLSLLLRPSVAFPVLLVAGASLAATVGRSALHRTYRHLAGLTAPSGNRDQVPLAVPVAALPDTAEPPTERPQVVPASAVPVARPAKTAGSHTRSSRTGGLSFPVQAPDDHSGNEPEGASGEPEQAAKAASTQETILIMTAVRALRREHDPARAGSLLDEYLFRYPKGVLREEALALAIEAASARGDARAAALAHVYLRRYPQGRFLSVARAAAE